MTRSIQPVLAWVRRAEPDVVELACAEHPDPARRARGSDVVRFSGCLADLPLHVPLEMLALGAGAVILRLDGCSRQEQAREWLAPLASLSGALGTREVRLVGEPTGTQRRRVLDAAHMPVPRRALLLLPAGDGDDLPDPDLTDHERLRDALARLATAPLEDRAGPGLVLAATGCEARGVCVRTCPGSALTLTTVDGVTSLALDPSRCTGCGACISSCDRHALTATGRHPWSALAGAPVQVLARVPTRTCARCSVPFAATDDARLCPVCAFRSARPFGSAVPPEALDRLPAHVADRLRGRT